MRKITTLLALGCAVCSTAFAAVIPGTTLDTSDLRMTEEGKQILNTLRAQSIASFSDMTANSNKVIMKTYEDANYIWTFAFAKNSQNWCDVLTLADGNHPTFAEVPYYWVNCNLMAQRKNAEGSGSVTAIWLPLMWPSMYVWEQMINDTDQTMPDDQKNFDIVGFDQMFEANPRQRGKDFYYTDNTALPVYYGDDAQSFLTGFPIAPGTWYGGDGWPQKYNNQDTYLVGNDQNQMSILSLDAVDLSEDVYTLACQFFFENGSKLNLTYDGTLRANGFVARNYELPIETKPIIVNMGDVDAKTLDLDNPWGGSSDWGPFSQWWIGVGIGQCEAVLRSGATFMDNKWGSVFGFTNPEGTDDSFSYFTAGFFKEAGATNPYGWYDLREPEVVYDNRGNYESNDMEPRLNQLAPAGYNDEYMPWSDVEMTEATTLVYGSYYSYLSPYTRMVIGDKDNGFWLTGRDDYKNTYHFSYKGDITLYTDKDDLSKTTTIPAVSDIDAVEGVAAEAPARVYAEHGVITVCPNAEGEVAVYTLSGARVASKNVKADAVVTFNVDKGIYLVKAGKTAKKVVL